MSLTSSLTSRIWPLTPVERRAWLMALVGYVAGDMATTALGIHLGAVEANPTGVWLIETIGLVPGMLAGKIAVLGLCAGVFRYVESSHRVAVPAALAAVGGVVTVYNAYVIVTLL